MIDRRYRQHKLALEKRFVTNSFASHFFTTMLGIHFTNVFFAVRYFKDSKVEFKDVMRELAISLIHNDHAAAELV